MSTWLIVTSTADGNNPAYHFIPKMWVFREKTHTTTKKGSYCSLTSASAACDCRSCRIRRMSFSICWILATLAWNEWIFTFDFVQKLLLLTVESMKSSWQILLTTKQTYFSRYMQQVLHAVIQVFFIMKGMIASIQNISE